MSTQPITRHGFFELVTPAELRAVKYRAQQRYYPAIEKAVAYLAHETAGETVRVKVQVQDRLKRMRESAIGYATRRGFVVATLHRDGWLYIERKPDVS